MRRVLLALILLLTFPAAADTPAVVVTVKPVHALIAGVMQGVAEPELLIDGAVSPHTYALKPSDARQLAKARVVFVVGARLEGFLDNVLENLASGTRVVEMAGLPGIRTLPVRQGGLWEAEEHLHDEHAHGEQGDEEDIRDAIDPHLWLDPANARLLVEAAAEALAEADADHAATYRRNASAVAAELDALDAELRQVLLPVRGVPYLVFHDGYHYFEERYGLSPAGSVTLSPERPPGPRRIAAIRARIVDGDIRCLFREPQFSPKLVDMLSADTSVAIGVLDAYGSDIPAGPGAYAAMMRGLADSLRRGLAD